MGRIAERVHTDQREIERIEALAAELPDEAIVELEMDDGRSIAGVVSVRPTVQVFRDAHDNEGINALVRIDDATDQAQAHYVWVDRIVRIRHRGSA